MSAQLAVRSLKWILKSYSDNHDNASGVCDTGPPPTNPNASCQYFRDASKKVAVLGHSFGGHLGQRLALRAEDGESAGTTASRQISGMGTGIAPPPPPSIPLRVARKLLNTPRVRRMQEDPLYVRAKRDDLHLRVIAASAVPKDGTVIDVGAHLGDFVKVALAVAPDGKHFAFEPLPEMAAALKKDFPGVCVREVALSSEPGEIAFLHVQEEPGYSGFRPGSYPGDYTPREITVRRARLDDELPADGDVALIKIDVEGAELEVLKGALETLRRTRPVVVFEHFKGHADAYGTTARDLHRFLVEEAGMRVVDIDGAGPLTAGQMQQAADAGAVWNFIARP